MNLGENEMKPKLVQPSSQQVQRSDSDRSESSSQSSPGAALEEKRKKLVPKAGSLLSAIMNETVGRDRSNSKSESVVGAEDRERERERGDGTSSGAERPTSHRVKRDSESSTGATARATDRERHLSSSSSAAALKQASTSSRSEHAQQRPPGAPAATRTGTDAAGTQRAGSRPPHSQSLPQPHTRTHTTSTSSSLQSLPERHRAPQSPPESGHQQQLALPHEHHSQPQPYPAHPHPELVMSNHVDHKHLPMHLDHHRSQSRCLLCSLKDIYGNRDP